MVSTTGDVVCFLSDLSDANGLRLALPPGHTGPVTVSVWQDEDPPICLGSYAVGSGSPADATLRKPGDCTLKWRWPGGPQRELKVKAGREEAILPAGGDP